MSVFSLFMNSRFFSNSKKHFRSPCCLWLQQPMRGSERGDAEWKENKRKIETKARKRCEKVTQEMGRKEGREGGMVERREEERGIDGEIG